jgi:hypothetical protein
MLMPPDSEEHLIRYLLRDLPDDETERLDERSVTDEAFAQRLRDVENDLVDRYAREGATDESLNRFEQRVRDSTYLRNKVQFVRALEQAAAPVEAGASAAPIVPTGRRRWLEGLAAAAVILLVVTGYLGLRTVALRDEVAGLETDRSEAERRNEQLHRDLEAARGTAQQSKTTTYVLRPPRRGAEEQTLTVPSGTTMVLLRVVIESSEYKTFWAALQDSASGRIIWRSGDLSGTADGGNRIVQVTIPLSLLASGRYSLDVSGNTRTRIVEPVGSYQIRVVLE